MTIGYTVIEWGLDTLGTVRVYVNYAHATFGEMRGLDADRAAYCEAAMIAAGIK